MTEFDIQESLFNRFRELNEFSGIGFLETDGEGNFTNAHFPNVPFSVPDDNRWFDISFVSNAPEPAALMEDAQNTYTGILYIDIYVPIDTYEDEARNKYKWIVGLFRRGLSLPCGIDIEKCYISTRGVDGSAYRMQVAVEWRAEIDKE